MNQSTSTVMAMEENVLFEIVVGTYEKFLLGFKFILSDTAKRGFELEPSFSTESHIQSVRCVTASGKYLASGSNDEIIQLYNMKSRKEIGSIIHHNGSISSLEFFDNVLLSASEDGTIIVWTARNWECAKTLKGHKKSVLDISIHPSGKMALSLGKDNTIRTWDLIKGRSVFVTNINSGANMIQWSPGGSMFLVVFTNTIDVYSTENAGVLHTIDYGKKICAVAFFNDNICAVGGEGEQVILYDISDGNKINEFKAHSTRTKVIKYIEATEEKFLVTASSDGTVKVWHFDGDQMDSKPRKVAELNSMSRPTCMTIVS